MKKLAILDDYQGVALELADWTPLDGDVEITVFREHLGDEDAVAKALADFEIVCIMRERTPFPASLLEKLPKLEHLFTSGIRNRSIDLAAAQARGIAVTGTATAGHPTPELTWGLILALARSIPYEDRGMREGRWAERIGIALKNKTLGLVGLGRMGAQVAKVGLAFGMNVTAWSSNLTQERCNEVGVDFAGSKEALLANADFVSIHLILGERSRGIIDKAAFAAMKPTAFLINTSRGPIVDEAALIEALENDVIAGAGLDVYDIEPLQADHKIRTLPNTVLMPHQGYVADDNYNVFYKGAVENIRSWLDGEVINELPPQK